MVPKITIGYRVGMLTVVSDSNKRKNGYTVWNCRCECGNFISLDTRALQRGTIHDCGCVSVVKPGQKDITGKHFGKLTAVKPLDKREDGSIVWHCRCDCGNEIDVSVHQLNSGCKKSCGCMRYITPDGEPILKDFMGKHFGNLTVVGYAGKRNGMHRWKCVCDCGNETEVGQTLLQTGKTMSCGCLKRSTLHNNLKLYNGTSITTLESVGKKIRCNNRSGYTGVYQNKANGRWNAQISFKGKKYYLGSFPTKQEAIEARQRSESLHRQAIEEYYAENKEE